MLEGLKAYLIEHNIEYKITYGGDNKDVENIEVDDFAIIEDSGKYMVCHVPTANFMWLTYPEVIDLLSTSTE